MPDELLTAAEVASRLKVATQTVRNWVDRGELPAIRVGVRRVRIRESDLEAFLEAEKPARPKTTDRVAELERRVGDLEARLEALEGKL